MDGILASLDNLANSDIFRASYTIAIFILGILFNSIRESNKRRRKESYLRKFIYLSIANFENATNRQIDVLKQASLKIKEENNDNIILDQIAAFNVDSIIKINELELFNSLVSSKINKLFIKKSVKIKLLNAFSSLSTKLYYFNRIANETIPNVFNKYYARVNEFELAWNNNIKYYRDIQNIIIDRIMKQSENDSFIREWIDIHHQYSDMNLSKESKSNPFSSWNNFHSKIRDLCIKHPFDPLAAKILIPLNDCLIELIKFRNNKDFFSKIFDSISSEIHEARLSLIDSTVIFKTLFNEQT